ncbi:MAG TPA: hypothetical protein HPP77_05740 [Candidatus Hydrogenedentes bacterium]|nr:hypothetical protein [Candidatus Hydrogenedentota bacterium]HIJ72673.1 hypothetical protein [Candidatus Hydrogenedentota bacterium]
MTSKERVLAAIAHEEPDRVPIQTYLTPEIQYKLLSHFNFADASQLYGKLGVDFRKVEPRRGSPLPPVPAGSDLVDEWGIGYVNFAHGHGGTYPEANYLSLARITTMAEFEAYAWPSADDYDYSHVEAQCDAVSEYAVCVGGAGTPDIVNGVSRGRGMQQVLVDIMTEDPVGVAIIDKRCDVLFDKIARSLDAANGKVDIVCLGEDTANQQGPMFPPAVFDRFFRPRLQRFFDLAHDYGCKAMLHSCGDTGRLQERFIEMGLDVLDAMQPEPAGMAPEEVKKRCAGRMALCGLISTQQTLPFGTVAACRAEARHRIDVIGRGGGYIFSPAHCIQPDTPLENVLAIYEEALGLEPGAFSH